jgi:four helix bundle protein
MNYKELDAWKESIELVQLVYEITQKFPSEEKFGLVSQLRRASVSVPSNIA